MKENRLYPFVPLLVLFVTQRVWRYSDFKISKMRQEGKSALSEPFEMQTKVKEVQMNTNDSLSNAVGHISISFKMANFPSWCLSEILKSLYLRTF